VYRFADGIVEVTLADFLAENPGKTETDFRILKEASDEIYLKQARAENRQTKKNVSLDMSDCADNSIAPPDEALIDTQDKESVAVALRQLGANGELSKTQARRFILYIDKGYSLRKIAALEGRSHVAVNKSIKQVLEKIKKYLPEQG
jgi:DNA-directed RNA polymerase specialized sigma24 family protein